MRDAQNRRPSFTPTWRGSVLFVKQTARSHCASGFVGTEFQAAINGVRIGEFNSREDAQRPALDAAQTKTPPRREPQGRELGSSFDY